jgi:hypothetical protein
MKDLILNRIESMEEAGLESAIKLLEAELAILA